jgi:hypothetical protein
MTQVLAYSSGRKTILAAPFSAVSCPRAPHPLLPHLRLGLAPFCSRPGHRTLAHDGSPPQSRGGGAIVCAVGYKIREGGGVWTLQLLGRWGGVGGEEVLQLCQGVAVQQAALTGLLALTQLPRMLQQGAPHRKVRQATLTQPPPLTALSTRQQIREAGSPSRRGTTVQRPHALVLVVGVARVAPVAGSP